MRTSRTRSLIVKCLLAFVLLATHGCASKPLVGYSTDTPPIALLPISQAGISDGRARFREIFCAVLETRREALPDYRPCTMALTQLGLEPEGSGMDVYLGPSKRNIVALTVAGVGWECVAEWVGPDDVGVNHVRSLGYDLRQITVDALSSSANNARQIRDGVLNVAGDVQNSPVVLIGYSKGTPDILEAIATYPELRERISAVISIAGAVGGSPLANDATQEQVNLMQNFPGADCEANDGGAISSLRPTVRQDWLAKNQLPDEIAYYSLAALPEPDRISTVLSSTYNRLSSIDQRNDGQLLFYDQVIPGSTLLGYLNADHWAVTIPIARNHPFVGTTLADRNDYPREAMLEALMRFVEEDLESRKSLTELPTK